MSTSSGSIDSADGGSTITTTTAAPIDFSQSLDAGETTMTGHKFFNTATAHTSTGSDPSMDKYTAAFSGAQVRNCGCVHGLSTMFGDRSVLQLATRKGC